MSKKSPVYKLKDIAEIYSGISFRSELSSEEDGEAEAPKTAVQRIHADLDKAIAKLQKLEGATFDIAEVQKRINAAKGMMPAL